MQHQKCAMAMPLSVDRWGLVAREAFERGSPRHASRGLRAASRAGRPAASTRAATSGFSRWIT